MPRFDASTPITKVEAGIGGRPAKVLDHALPVYRAPARDARLSNRSSPRDVSIRRRFPSR